VASALPRLDALIAEGVTTVEIKSGYGLSPESEARMLRAARALGRERPVTIRTTFLGAHAVPPEFDGDADGYIDLVCDRMLPAVAAAGLADAVDGFCEGIAFSPAQIERVFARARELGLPVKLHAEQLSNLGGAALAARHGALGRSPRTTGRGRHRGDEAGRHRGGAAARCVLFPARDAPAADRPAPRRRRAHRHRHRLQPRHLATHLAAADDEHGRHAVPPDGGGMPDGRDPQRRAALGLGHETGTLEAGHGATSPSGTSKARPNLSIAWASTRSMPVSGEGNERRT
jgi:hypothetical protein